MRSSTAKPLSLRRSVGSIAMMKPPMLVPQIKARCAAVPGRLLADTGAMTQDDIASLAEKYTGMAIFSPPPKEKDDVREETT